ncbi:hypothetical protein WMY93_033040 [Mugilogobius chulae]|uniref:Uncharacterized protein n=1 Tax=Mugilogobius chulae TaxID=88201 RepID=A0AAW0MJQ1_9GOBI
MAMPALSSIHGDLSEREEDFAGVEAMNENIATPTEDRSLPEGTQEEIDVDLYNDIQQSILEWTNDVTWSPSQETQVVSTSEEDHTVDTDDSVDSDEDYIPQYRIRTGAALRCKLM